MAGRSYLVWRGVFSQARLSPEDATLFLAEYAQRQRGIQPAQFTGGTPVEILRQRRVLAVGRRCTR